MLNVCWVRILKWPPSSVHTVSTVKQCVTSSCLIKAASDVWPYMYCAANVNAWRRGIWIILQANKHFPTSHLISTNQSPPPRGELWSQQHLLRSKHMKRQMSVTKHGVSLSDSLLRCSVDVASNGFSPAAAQTSESLISFVLWTHNVGWQAQHTHTHVFTHIFKHIQAGWDKRLKDWQLTPQKKSIYCPPMPERWENKPHTLHTQTPQWCSVTTTIQVIISNSLCLWMQACIYCILSCTSIIWRSHTHTHTHTQTHTHIMKPLVHGVTR